MALGLAVVVGLTGCGARNSRMDTWEYTSLTPTSDGVTFSLLKGLDITELAEFADSKVEFYGYMSIDHEESENEYKMITYLPEGFCTYHFNETSEMVNSIPIRLESDFEYTYVPLKIKGVVKVGNIKDTLDHTFSVVIEDVTVEEVKVDNVEGILKTYIELANQGIFETMRKEYVAIDRALGYSVFGLRLNQLEEVDNYALEEVKKVVATYNEDESLNDLVESLDRAIKSGVYVNNVLTNTKDLEEFQNEEIIENTFEMFNLYQNWQLKYAIN
jgi:hypothetical protein